MARQISINTQTATTMLSEDEFSPTPAPLSNGDGLAGVGLSNPQLSQGRRRMLDLVNRLHSTGVQVDIDIPQIAVIGQQSAGKSSLIEAISGITLPRSAGTCTRCPTECRLLCSQSPWQCIVALRFTTNSKGQPLGQARNENFGPIIYDKSQVEERIRRAQRAILNPSQPFQRFLEDKEESQDSSSGELSFSNNCVSLQISGPDMADLSFCDLPGLISSVSSSSKGGSNNISLIENLVTSYIKKPSCIILLTVACETDFENQGAHHLTKQYDPDGKRTIGVLTKPDRIPTGEVTNWLPFIRNEKEPLENGWYCVKQPGSDAIKLGITWAQARKEEEQFFAGWSDRLDPVYMKYLTTSNLVDRLSLILSDLISKRLPEIHEELEKSISVTRGLISALPKAPSSDPLNEICTLIHSFTVDLARHIEGVPDHDGLLQVIRPSQEKFRKSIRMTAPNFRPFESFLKEQMHLNRASFLANEDDEDEIGEASDNEMEGRVNSVKKAKPQGSIISRKIYIDEVMEKAQQARTRELPGSYPFVVQKSFIDDFIKHWRTPSMNLCKVVHTVLFEHVKKLVHKHFGAFGQGLLEQRVRATMHQHISICLEKTQERITWLLKLEDKPFSLNTHYLADYKAKFLAYYKGNREQQGNPDLINSINAHNNPPPPPTFSFESESEERDYGYTHGTPAISQPQPTVKGALASLAAIGLQGIKAEDLPKLLPSDRMEPALVIMADVRAYFQVAYKRFADNVPLAIDLDLVQGADQNILSTLYSNLGINGQDGIRVCKELAQESPQIADRRADLLKKLERLEIANDELLHVGG